MHRTAWAGLALLLLLPAARADTRPSTPADLEAASLVRQLGDQSFAERQKAARQLAAMRRIAKPALLEGLRADDSEVVARCRRLLPAALADDRAHRLAEFVADKDGKLEHDLPGWKRYRTVVGKDGPARDLFVAMCKADGELLEDAERNPKTASSKCQALAWNLQQKMYGAVYAEGRRIARVVPAGSVEVGDLALLLFVGSDAKVVALRDPMNFQLANLFYHAPVQQAIRSGSASGPLKKLLGQFIESQSDTNAVNSVLYLVQQLELKECLGSVAKVVRDKDQTAYARALGMTILGKLGTKDHLALLEPLLTDDTLLGNFPFGNIAMTTQLRDVALAMSLHLSGQLVKDYPFAMLKTNPAMLFQYHYLGFSEDKDRTAAFAKWKEWKATQKK